MKKLIIHLLLLAMALPGIAAVNITGKVIDAKKQTPLEYVNVILLEPNNKTPLKKVTTNHDGAFKMPVKFSGRYVLKINFVGYKTNKQYITLTDESQDIGVVELEEKSESLSAVEVLGQGSQMHFELDKKVFSVDKNIASSGGSITDVLKNIPSVDVDVEGNISLRNDNNVEVWINGKSAGLTAANRAQILEQMPADDVKNIEIITNPSAKYSASGTAGIINLVMKENKKPGYYGGIMAGVTRASAGKIGGLAGANISYSNKKIDVYANAGYRDVVKQGYGWTDRYRFSGGDTTKLRKDNSKLHENKSPFLRAGIDYHVNSKNTIGLSGFGLLSSESYDNYIHYTKTSTADNSIMKLYSRENIQSGYRPTVHISMDYKHEFDKSSDIKASITYSHHKTGGDYEFIQKDSFPSVSLTDLYQNAVNNSSHLNFKIDFSKEFAKNKKLEIGWRTKALNSLDESYGTNLLTGAEIASFYNKFDYKEQVHSGYATFSNRMKNLSYLAGLRGEYMTYISTSKTATYTTNNPRQSYFNLFPSVFLSYNLPARNEIQLNFTRRINRPSALEINPFHDYSDANDIDYGNATLSPEYSSAMELNYIKYWDNHSISGSLYYKQMTNSIEDVSFVNPTNSDVMDNTYLNISGAKKTGMELIAKNSLFSILDLTSALNMYYNRIDSASYKDVQYGVSTFIPSQSSFSWTGKMIANVMMTRTFSGQIIGEYSSSKIITQGKRSPNYSVDLGLRKTFFDRNLTASFTFRDIFNSDRKRSNISGTGFYETSETIPHGRTLRLTVSYNFGNMKSKKRAELEKKQDITNELETDTESTDSDDGE